MDINRANMTALFTAYSKDFKDGYETKKSLYEQFTMERGINSTRLELPFLQAFANMREWIGSRQVKQLESQKVIYTEKSFEETVAVPVRDIETDNFGLYSEMIAQMGDSAADQKGINAIEALYTNDTWIDGVDFYSASGRSYGGNTISNFTTAALAEASFNAAYLAMSSYKGANDKALKSVPNVIMVGPSLRTTAWNILKNQFTYDGTDKVQIQNVNQNLVDFIINPDLVGDYANYWFLMNTNSRIKPVFLNVPKAPTLIAKTKLDDENVFDEDQFLYGTTLRTAVGKTFPHLCYMSNGTA